MLATSFGYGYHEGVAGWVALVKLPDKEQAFFGRGDTPKEAGEHLERALDRAFELGEIR